MSQRPVVIVGAGPAGMAAAITVAGCGLDVTLVDQNSHAGGQIYRVPAVTPHRPNPPTRGDQLREQLSELGDRIELFSDREVLGIFEQRRLALRGPRGWETLEAEHLLLATGAYEYVPPFPGWTLPGVMTPGAAQQLVKSQGVVPEGRVLVAGTGPFLLVVALALHEAGVKVAGICETLRRRDVFWKLPGLLADLSMLGQGHRYLKRIRQAGIPLWTGRLVTRAEGEDRLQRVLIAPCDGEWYADHSRGHQLDVDTLCVGYGFVPRIGLPQLAGCELTCHTELGGWAPRVDAWGETSVPNVWAAGDGAGVAGAVVADLAGELSGLAIATRAGALNTATCEDRAEPVRQRLSRLARFRGALDRLGRIRPGLSALADEQTIVCRCEELTRTEVDLASATGSVTLRALKVATRLGMGPCQGRMCQPAAAYRLAAVGQVALDATGPPSFRPPLTPVTLGDLAGPTGEGS